MKKEKRKARVGKKMDRAKLALFASICVLVMLILVNLYSLTGLTGFAIHSASAGSNNYTADIHFIIQDGIYNVSDRIELRGSLLLSNYSSDGTLISSSLVSNGTINVTIRNTGGAHYSNYTLLTDANGSFYSRSSYYTSAILINAPNISGNYIIRAEYRSPDNLIWYSEVSIQVSDVNIDSFRINPERARYNPSERVLVNLEAVRLIGDKTLYVSGVLINGSLRNSSNSILSRFSCTTGSSGRCTANVTAPAIYGSYTLEAGGFKAFSSFSVVPFFFNVYMKDELGESAKNVFSIGEQGTVEVSIINASSSDSYSFSGYISDSSGNVVKSIDTTALNSNNSFENSFLFTVDSLSFSSAGSYIAYITVTKSGDGSILTSRSFEIQDWSLSVEKRSANSGFEYEYTSFPNTTLRLEAYPKYRTNGTLITNLSSALFSISLRDGFNNILISTNATWNASCGKEGCYEFSLITPSSIGRYGLYTTLSYSGSTRGDNKIIDVVNGVMSAQSTDKSGNIKELFGANEYAYISVNAYNLTSAQFNLSDAELFSVSYTNGSEIGYSQVSDFDSVNLSSSTYQWAWNASLQRIKLVTPKFGGLYNIFLFANNKSIGANAQFIVNPYDSCIVSKNTPGQTGSGGYYVWQFTTTDTIYFEIKLNQASNPLGKASASNTSSSNGSSYGMGSACVIDSTKQVVNNATLTIAEVRNTESGEIQNFNTSESNCQANDNSGGYSCTLKPINKWSGGVQSVKFNIAGADGTTSITYGRFESRAFYMYGWTQNWQNSPENNISLSIKLYEAVWSGGSSGGLGGTVILKKVEYMGGDGEWIWPPVDSGYNASAVNSSTITGGSGTLTMPSQLALGGSWKTGNYRAVLQATTTGGDSDYGYAYFGVKLWDVYGTPVECTASGCSYKNYFNSKENISLYVRISQAGNYNDNGGQGIYGNVSVGIKKIQDCRSWPCKDLNSSQYTASRINVNSSSTYYWNANINNQSRYIIQINTTSGTWNSGYYSVVLDVNGTDTGYAYFNTIAFYVDSQPTNSNGSAYKYNIRGDQPMFFNITATKSYKNGYYSTVNGSSVYVRYNLSDYINVTVDDFVLRTWDYQTSQTKELNYPEDLNISSLRINGNGLANISYLNGSWPTGYYYGEITTRNSENETTTGWLWFNVQPFRVQLSSSTYSIDNTICVNASISIYDPDWSVNSILAGNYSISDVYETVWGGYSSTKVSYTNYTTSSFNGSGQTVSLCPNNGSWGAGSWGGYHNLNVVVNDSVYNDTQTGWLSFRAVPFQISWGSISGGSTKSTNQNIVVPVSLSRSSGANASGNLTSLYQWRYDNYLSTREAYTFKVGNCYSNVSGKCTVNSTSNVTIYAPSNGWKIGYNYIYATWSSATDASVTLEDTNGLYLEGRESYSGSFDNVDVNGNWKYYFAANENLTIRLNMRDLNYNTADVNVSSVQYALSPSSCWDEWCRTYSNADWSLANGGASTANGKAIIRLKAPSGGWDTGIYYIKVGVTGSSGSAIIIGGNVRVKDMTAPNLTVTSPVNNGSYINRISVNFTSTKNSQCYLYLGNYNMFYTAYCPSNSSNISNSSYTSSFLAACNTTTYGFNGSIDFSTYVSDNYFSQYNNGNYTWFNGATGFSTGATVHSYAFNSSRWPAQHYALNIYCYDSDSNYVSEWRAIKVNATS